MARPHDEQQPQHAVFYAIAYTRLVEASALSRERSAAKKRSSGRDSRGGSRSGPDPDFMDYLAVSEAKEERAATAAVVFGALTLEAFINHYAISGAPWAEKYFDTYLERVFPRTKWLVFPWLTRGDVLADDILRGVRTLLGRRNTLAHFRRTSPMRLRIGDAQEAVRTVRKAVMGLARLDPAVDIKWLSEVEKEPVT